MLSIPSTFFVLFSRRPCQCSRRKFQRSVTEGPDSICDLRQITRTRPLLEHDSDVIVPSHVKPCLPTFWEISSARVLQHYYTYTKNSLSRLPWLFILNCRHQIAGWTLHPVVLTSPRFTSNPAMSSAADRNSPPGPSPTRRRSSFAGQFVDMFGSRPSNAGNSNQTMQGPISTAAMQAQTRRLSLTTIGLSGSPNPTSPFFPNGRPRTESISSSNSGTVDESPFEDGDAGTAPASPFARRLSFGARAMRDMRSSTGNANANGRPSVSIAKSPPTSKKGRGLFCHTSFCTIKSP